MTDDLFESVPDPDDVPSRMFSAAFDGSCAGCGRFIHEGDEIAMLDGMAYDETCILDMQRHESFVPRWRESKFTGTSSEEMGF